MKVSEIRKKLLLQSYTAMSLANKAKVLKDNHDFDNWTSVVKINRDYISYIDYVQNNEGYYKSHKEAIAEKLYWVLSHVEKCDIMIREYKENN